MSPDEIVCREFVELATDYLDGALPEPTLEVVEEHLAMCDWCREYLREIRTTAGAVAETAEEPRFAPAEPVMQQLVGAFRRRRYGGPPG